MSVYVDPLRDYGWRLGMSCHLTADSVEELHAFAASIGLRRSWFQTSRSGVPHYDLTARKRSLALSRGAVDAWKDQATKEAWVAIQRRYKACKRKEP